tara:strand:+ start:659 stop:1798 length:1140 start_codon:yes stop_codon:yes gene_type:complete
MRPYTVYMKVVLYLFWLLLATEIAANSADFTVSILTNDVPNARQMAETTSGLLLVGTRRAGKLYAVVPPPTVDADPEVVTFATGLTMPSGIALLDGDLYVGALNRILRFPSIETTFRENPQPQIISDELPKKRHHGWKYLSVGPDRHLYVPVGAPCNICLSDDERYASILRVDPRTGASELYARGVRNSVGMAWHPKTHQLWFSDNGRDMLGDDVPDEEINVVEKPGAHYGYPFLHAGVVQDPKFGKEIGGRVFTPPKVRIQAHSAVLGMDFYTKEVFPPSYRNALFIAEHGSWNRTKKVGYRVSVIRIEADQTLTYEPFLDIWLNGQKASGRPNDVLVSKDGSLLISDDQEGVIYRVVYAGKANDATNAASVNATDTF